MASYQIYTGGILRKYMVSVHSTLCSGTTRDTRVRQVYGSWQRAVLNPEHRVKPENLLTSMTDRPVQFEEQVRRPWWYAIRVYDGCPASYYSSQEYWGTGINVARTTVQPADNATNWMLDLRLKIKDDKVNLASMIAEYRETARAFHSLAKNILDTVRSIRKAKLPRWLRSRTPLSKTAATEYLTHTYGTLPLCSDLHDILGGLQERLQLPIYKKYVVTKRVTSSGFHTQDSYTGHDAWKADLQERAIAYVKFDPDGSVFTTGNPLEWVWEATPFSFVVDWAIPIGDYLASLDALLGCELYAGSLTRKRQYNSESSLIPEPRAANETMLFDGIGKSWYKSFEREKLTNVPLPALPGYEPSESLHAILNGLALLRALR